MRRRDTSKLEEALPRFSRGALAKTKRLVDWTITRSRHANASSSEHRIAAYKWQPPRASRAQPPMTCW
jgi:hypothetical protein